MKTKLLRIAVIVMALLLPLLPSHALAVDDGVYINPEGDYTCRAKITLRAMDGTRSG